FYEAATKWISYANALGCLSGHGFRPVRLSMQFGDGPSKTQVVALESIGPRRRFGMMTVTATAPDGTAVPHPPSPWPGRFALATSNPDVAEVLEIQGQPEP